MSQPCAIITCKRASRALCHCCQQNVCIPHLNEHNDLLNSQLNPLADEINALGERLKTFNIQDIVGDCRWKLEQWRQDCYEKINHFFEQKSHELDRLVAEKLNRQRERTTHIRSKVAELIHDQEATQQDIDTLTSTIRQLEKEMNNIEQAHFQINTRPLLVDDSIIQFEDIYEHDFDLSALSPAYRTIVRPQGSCRALASNGRLLLIHQAPNLCFLNTELTKVKQVLWPYDVIGDMCWSSTLNRFIVISKENFFLVDENTMSIESVQAIAKQRWLSGTCFNDELFLSTGGWGSFIVEVRLSPSITVVKEWRSPITCATDESIDDMVCNDGILALVIRNGVEQSMRMELRSCKTLDRLWSVLLDIKYDKDTAFRFCSLDCNGWLVADYNAGRLLHITRDGKMNQTITYKAIPLRIAKFTSNMLDISTETGLSFHKI